MTLYTLENLIQIACFDVSSSELVILSEIKVRMPFRMKQTVANVYIPAVYIIVIVFISKVIFFLQSLSNASRFV